MRHRSWVCVTFAFALATASGAENLVFPPDAGVIDVTKPPYGAKGDGQTDDTQAIQQALNDHPNQGAIIYLPHGTYRIAATLKWPHGSRGGMEEKNTILQGQSRDGTIIRLKDQCPGFADARQRQALLWTGRKPAQRFRNAVRNLTLHTGRGNPGAVGAQSMANSQGAMLDGWWYVNRGIELWRSRDLKDWESLGLVWSIEKDGTWQKEFKDHDSDGRKSALRRALWAPEIHHLKGTFWLTYSMNYGGTGLLKSTTGKPQGPCVDVQPAGPLTPNIDASLFQDDDGGVYFVWKNGMIARLKDDLAGLVETPRQLKPANHTQVGFEGAFLTKVHGKYLLLCADFNPASGGKTYDCMAAVSDNLYGPYGGRYLAIPHAGHNMQFRDKGGGGWSTFFGHNQLAPIRERPAILPIHLNAAGKIEVGR